MELVVLLLLAASVLNADAADSEEQKNLDFVIQPEQGTQGGGTQVTITILSQVPRGHHGNFWCKFGMVTVPAQSYFKTSSGPSVLCQAPAGPPRVTKVALSLDGQYFHPGPKFVYTGDGDY